MGYCGRMGRVTVAELKGKPNSYIRPRRTRTTVGVWELALWQAA
jgi:hypothetical protein